MIISPFSVRCVDLSAGSARLELRLYSCIPRTSSCRCAMLPTDPFPGLVHHSEPPVLPTKQYRPFPLHAGWLKRAPREKPILPRGKIIGFAHRVVSQQRGLGVLTLSWSPSSVLRRPESDQPRRRDRRIDVSFFSDYRRDATTNR